MANLVIRKIHIPAISTMEATYTNKIIKKLQKNKWHAGQILMPYVTHEKPINNIGLSSLGKNPLDP
jgi:hypothetical protein